MSCPSNDALVDCGSVPGKDRDCFPRAEADPAALFLAPHEEVNEYSYSSSASGS